MSVKEHITAWLGEPDQPSPPGLTPKTTERYRQLAEQQIYPHLGTVRLQKLKPAQIQAWHDTLVKSGGKDGKPLSARTVGHAHRVLHRALQRAVEAETLIRNAASVIKPPKVEEEEIEILEPEQIGTVLSRLSEHELHPIVFFALATGLRRGELLGLRLGDVDPDSASLRVERAVEETKAGLRLKPPKTKRGRRSLALPASAVAVLRSYHLAQLKIRLALGLGRPGPDALLFSNPDGSLRSPDNLSRDWKRAVVALELPQVTFHALRHTHVSALIAGGLDVVTISRRIGHSSPAVTLRVYAHLFRKTDTEAAGVIEAALRTVGER